ncbi:hypothetical protein LguiB_007611 [Lonicera macranthoides]
MNLSASTPTASYCQSNGNCHTTPIKQEVLLLPLPREKLFRKVLTKSDVKQHRLAIPKNQARKHFLLHDNVDSSKVALLCMYGGQYRQSVEIYEQFLEEL